MSTQSQPPAEPQALHYHWRCSRCANAYTAEAVRYTCPRCGPNAALDMVPDYARIAAYWPPAQLAADPNRTIWRYTPLLPVSRRAAQNGALAAVGWTPLVPAGRLGQALGLRQLLIKDDGRNPTASFKDRASAVVLARALEQASPVVATASSGNAAAALAGLGAAAGVRCLIFVPESAPEAKVVQLLIYGAEVLLVEGSYDQAYELCREACDAFGWYCRNTAYNPLTTEGKKTCGLEIVEQLGMQAPDTVIVSVGDGNIITGLHRGFADAFALGWIDRLPRLIGVQAEGAPAVYRAWQTGAADVAMDKAETIADSINVGLPRDGYRALRALRETGGRCLAVSDAAILQAMARVAQLTGIFTEPACAATFAGLFALVEQGAIAPDERVVIVNTGNGLKDVRAAARAAGAPQRVAPTLDAVRTAIT